MLTRSGDVAAQGEKELVDGGEFLGGADVQRDGTRVEVGRSLPRMVGVAICEVVETVHHAYLTDQAVKMGCRAREQGNVRGS